MPALDVRSLHIYPVKGMRAVDVDRARVEERGLVHDRRWLVVDRDGGFLTQRTHPKLATITARPTARGLVLSAGDGDAIEVAYPSGRQRRMVVVWSSEVDAAVGDPAADEWLSERLGAPAALVFMDARALRMKDSMWTSSPAPVSFADAFPVLVATTGSLAALNQDIEAHGGAPVPMTRFRPNVVIGSDEPWAEDRWRRIDIGSVRLDLVKPSDRCIVTTTDQRTGERMGKEPLAALARLRRSTDPRIDGVVFAVNAVPLALGEIRVGDRVAVIR